jgi:hypothetical protein
LQNLKGLFVSVFLASFFSFVSLFSVKMRKAIKLAVSLSQQGRLVLKRRESRMGFHSSSGNNLDWVIRDGYYC